MTLIVDAIKLRKNDKQKAAKLLSGVFRLIARSELEKQERFDQASEWSHNEFRKLEGIVHKLDRRRRLYTRMRQIITEKKLLTEEESDKLERSIRAATRLAL